MHHFALEVWIKVGTSLRNFTPPEEEMYSADFILDTLNLTYPGCTRVFLVMLLHSMAVRDLSEWASWWNRVRRLV